MAPKWERSHPLKFPCLSLINGQRKLFVSILFYELGALMPVPPRIKVCRLDMQTQIKLVQFKKIMNYLLLPHELNQRHKTEDFEYLKIAHKLYTLGVVVNTTNRKVWWTLMADIGFRVWMHKQNSAYYRVWLAKA